MRAALVIAATLLPLAPAEARFRPGLAAPERCGPVNDKAADRGVPRAGPRRLGDMPPATRYKALWYAVNGCPQPIVVRSGVGGAIPRR